MRFLAPFDHLRPIWFYVPILLVGLLPGTLLLAPFVRFLFSGGENSPRLRPVSLGFLLLAGAWCVLFFSLSGSKLPTYILPAFPPLALALGSYAARGTWIRPGWMRGAAATGFTAIFMLHNFGIPWYAGYRGPVGSLQEVAEYCRQTEAPIVCYSRNCDSVAFYVGRDDFRTFRSKQVNDLISYLLDQPRTLVLFSHRHSMQALEYALPPELKIVPLKHLGLGDLPGVPPTLMPKLTWLMGETALGLCDVAMIERRPDRLTDRQPTLRPPLPGQAVRGVGTVPVLESDESEDTFP
jgi:hypothetical protein